MVQPPSIKAVRQAEEAGRPAIWAERLKGLRQWANLASERAINADYLARNLLYLPDGPNSDWAADFKPLVDALLNGDAKPMADHCHEHPADYTDFLERAGSLPIPSLTVLPQEIPAHEKLIRERWVPDAFSFNPPKWENVYRKDFPKDEGRFYALIADTQFPLTEGPWRLINDCLENFKPNKEMPVERSAYEIEADAIRKLLRAGKRVEAFMRLAMLPKDQRGGGKRAKYAWRSPGLDDDDAKARAEVIAKRAR
jgi:hypothetical protein